MIINISKFLLKIILAWVLSSVVEHLTADQEVIGSNPIVPLIFFKKYKITDLKVIHYFIVLIFGHFYAMDRDKHWERS